MHITFFWTCKYFLQVASHQQLAKKCVSLFFSSSSHKMPICVVCAIFALTTQDNFTVSPSLSMRRPLHRQGRGDGSPNNSHTRLQQCVTGGWASSGTHVVRRIACRRTHNRDSPCDRHGRRLSDSLRQMVCYEPQGAGLQSEVLSAPIPLGIRGHRRCLLYISHVLVNTSSCNSWALAGWGNRTNLLSHRRALWLFSHNLYSFFIYLYEYDKNNENPFKFVGFCKAYAALLVWKPCKPLGFLFFIQSSLHPLWGL